MSGGIPVEDSCIKAFHVLKSKRNVNTVIYRLSDNLETVTTDFKGNLTHDELLEALPAAETRFVIYDPVFATADGTRKDKIVLISWCPEAAEIEQRVAHSTTRNALRDLLDGVQAYVQATDLSDVEYDELVSRTS
ncbi:actin-binding ADF family protein [Streptomyces sp. NPDC001773]|uniref:actin-binding ADF family protein n=1 Tax=Streptomyces sp. NPDC005499 TaxID=3154883 RepID=UPI0033A4A248